MGMLGPVISASSTPIDGNVMVPYGEILDHAKLHEIMIDLRMHHLS